MAPRIATLPALAAVITSLAIEPTLFVQAESQELDSGVLRGSRRASSTPTQVDAEPEKQNDMIKGSCHGDGFDCKGPDCCPSGTTCFQKNTTFAGCRPSCAPGKPAADADNDVLPWTCRMPFSHMLAQARETYRWPDIAAVCGAGDALVEPDAFYSMYGSSCSVYCMWGAGRVVMPELNTMWMSLDCDGCGQPGSCKADLTQQAATGIRCTCSFPDRL